MHDFTEKPNESSQRDLLKGIAGLPPLATARGGGLAAQTSRSESARSASQNRPASDSSSKKKFVALQIGARSFVDEGVDKCLDTIQERAGVNVLMSTVLTYGSGLAGRQTRPTLLPD